MTVRCAVHRQSRPSRAAAVSGTPAGSWPNPVGLRCFPGSCGSCCALCARCPLTSRGLLARLSVRHPMPDCSPPLDPHRAVLRVEVPAGRAGCRATGRGRGPGRRQGIASAWKGRRRGRRIPVPRVAGLSHVGEAGAAPGCVPDFVAFLGMPSVKRAPVSETLARRLQGAPWATSRGETAGRGLQKIF